MKERGAVMSILETEYNEKAYGKTRYDEGVQAGIEQGLEKGLEQGKQSEKIETILPKAEPIIIPTARSKTFPFMANSLNSVLTIYNRVVNKFSIYGYILNH